MKLERKEIFPLETKNDYVAKYLFVKHANAQFSSSDEQQVTHMLAEQRLAGFVTPLLFPENINAK